MKSSNGRELNNKLLKEISDHLNILIRSTTAESPWSNGVTEMDSAILGNMISKLMFVKSSDYPMEVLLQRQLVQKMHSITYRYSTNQLVLSKIQIFPQ